jgi:hypothetical protein
MTRHLESVQVKPRRAERERSPAPPAGTLGEEPFNTVQEPAKPQQDIRLRRAGRRRPVDQVRRDPQPSCLTKLLRPCRRK